MFPDSFVRTHIIHAINKIMNYFFRVIKTGVGGLAGSYIFCSIYRETQLGIPLQKKRMLDFSFERCVVCYESNDNIVAADM